MKTTVPASACILIAAVALFAGCASGGSIAASDQNPPDPTAGAATGPVSDPRCQTRRYVEAYIKTSPAIAERLGAVVSVAPAGPVARDDSAAEPILIRRRPFEVRGDRRSEILTIYWERRSASDPIVITIVAGTAGELITL